MVIVETSSYCDLSCLHCPRTDLAKSDDSFEGFMDFDLWKKIVDEVAKYKRTTLRPFNRGEALINPDLVRMIRYAKKRGVGNIWLNTNGLLLSPEKSKELLDTGIDIIELSIDAASRETFKKIKGKDVYDTVVENTIACCRQKKESYPKTKIVVSFVESSLNASEKDVFLNFWKDYADYVNVRPVHQAGALLGDLRKSKGKKEDERLPCSMLWERLTITYSGDVCYCELDWEIKGKIGNVRDLSIKEIWNSEKYQQLRKLHIEKKFSEISLCNVCESYYEIMGWR
ncbi:MAG: radical SAM/SPASM domain-containing protein [Candidatus Omnitrophota bacterium]